MKSKKRQQQAIDNNGVVRTVVRSPGSQSAKAMAMNWDQEDGGDGGDERSVSDAGKGGRILFILLGVGFFALLIWGAVMVVGSSSEREAKPVMAKDESIKKQMLGARQVAESFLAEQDAQKRLLYVRDPEVVKTHMARYDEEALTFPAEKIKEMGTRVSDGGGQSAYVVTFASGNVRLLSVVKTDQGLKVDWDSYARYCSESWETLFSGDAQEAVVRVLVRPGNYHVGHFRDPRKWTCFLLQVPDSDRQIYAYAMAGGELAKRMQSAVMKNRGFRQLMTLRIQSIAVNGELSGKEALFEVDELLAMGWVVKVK